jgi:ubiquilin
MADTTAAGGSGAESSEPQEITFKIKAAGDKVHEVTMSEGATVLDLKTKLSGEAYENVATDRQRLIYSGRVMKNDDKLAVYKIKPGNTVHLVKSAASNPARQAPSSSAGPTQPAIPSNMAAGTNNDILSGLTGARFAGMANLPSASIFGADGGVSNPFP